ncbi:hypothetical protein [Enterococcus sp. AZ192]|uniref:hypothetical protein n=1 Tax=unclassified Enterococcus TaxID=2608891 RepID=UPI003D2DE1AA
MSKSIISNFRLLIILLVILIVNTFTSLVVFRLAIYYFSDNLFFVTWVNISLILDLLQLLLLIKPCIFHGKLTITRNNYTKSELISASKIKNYSFLFITLLIQLLPAIYIIADKDDAPGLILIFSLSGILMAILATLNKKASFKRKSFV